jgi:hypothetical protein
MQKLMVGSAVYTGSLVENMPHGEGELIVDGLKLNGKWYEGLFVETLN